MRRTFTVLVVLAACGGQGDGPRPVDAVPATAIAPAVSREAVEQVPWEQRRAEALVQIDALVAKSDHPGALRELARLREIAKNDPAINRRFADALFAEARYEEAEGVYAWLVEHGRASKEPDARLAHDLARLADLAGRNGEVDRSRELLDEAKAIDAVAVQDAMPDKPLAKPLVVP
jgi:hypothetical protein